jgi:hypothetical protein
LIVPVSSSLVWVAAVVFAAAVMMLIRERARIFKKSTLSGEISQR